MKARSVGQWCYSCATTWRLMPMPMYSSPSDSTGHMSWRRVEWQWAPYIKEFALGTNAYAFHDACLRCQPSCSKYGDLAFKGSLGRPIPRAVPCSDTPLIRFRLLD